MKVCSKCGNNCPDGASFCNVCGSPLGAEAAQDSTNTQDAAQNAYQAPQQAYAYVDPSDHTAEFDAADISENKVLAMLPYLLSWIGVIVALLGSHDSKFAAFHVKQALKLTVRQLAGQIAFVQTTDQVVQLIHPLFGIGKVFFVLSG